MKTLSRMKIKTILCSLMALAVNGMFAQVRTADNSRVLFEINNDAPVRLQNKTNNTQWNLSQDKLYEVSSKNPSKIVNTLSLNTNARSEAVLSLSVKNTSDKPVDVTVTFPIVKGVHFAEDRNKDLYYLYPKEGWASTNENADEDNYYGRWFPLQFVDIYDKDNGGFYIMTKDTTAYPKKYCLKKKDGKIDFKVTHQIKRLQPGEVWNMPATVIGAHKGDWHGGFNAYRDWVKTWYKPIAPRKQWFQDIYNFRQVFLHTFFGEEGAWDPVTKKIRLLEYVNDAEKAFGGVDYVHIFDWMREPEDRIYNYTPWKYLGGHQQLKDQIATLYSRGIRTGLYYQGYKIYRKSEIGLKYGKDWETIIAPGKDCGDKGYHYPCPSAPGWQEYFTDVAKRTTELLNTNGVYFDQYGFGYLTDFYGCYNAEHGHPDLVGPIQPNYMGIGEINMWKKLRTKINQDVVTYNEEMPTDVGTQYLDGTYTYAINKSGFTPSKNPSSVNLFRFIFPGFKIIEMLAVDRPFDDNVTTQLKNVFFNGEGIFLQGPLNDTGWFTTAAKNVIRKTHAILRSNKDAFRSDETMPLIKTMNDDVHCNYFHTPKKNVWTFFNVSKSDFAGNILKVPHMKGAHYYDAWHFKPITPVIKDGYAILNIKVKSQDAGCVVQSMEKMNVVEPTMLPETKSTPVETIVMQTSMAKGAVFSFQIVADGTGEVYVDWGDGKLLKHEISKSIKNITELKNNLMSDDGIVKVYVSNRYVTYLDCNNADLTRLEVDKAPMLTYLKCFGNKLSNIDLSKNLELILFRCMRNNFSSLDVSHCFKLKDLQIGSNGMSTLKGVENLYALQTLITAGNPIKRLDLRNNPNLETLNVRNSGLSELDLSGNKKLLMVDITNGGPKDKNTFTGASLNALYRSLPDRYDQKEGVVKVVLSKDNQMNNDAQGSTMSIARSKNWSVTDVRGSKL